VPYFFDRRDQKHAGKLPELYPYLILGDFIKASNLNDQAYGKGKIWVNVKSSKFGALKSKQKIFPYFHFIFLKISLNAL
jgi:hypothetical protein